MKVAGIVQRYTRRIWADSYNPSGYRCAAFVLTKQLLKSFSPRIPCLGATVWTPWPGILPRLSGIPDLESSQKTTRHSGA